MRQIRPRGGYFPAHPMSAPREAIKARVEIPAIVGDTVKKIEIFSDVKGVTAFRLSAGVEVRIDDEVLMDALARVQQPEWDVIGAMPVMVGGHLGHGISHERPLQTEKHEEIFEGVFEAGQEKSLRVAMQVIFRANQIEIDEGGEEAFMVKSLKVGISEQFAVEDSRVPLELLAMNDLDLETARPGQQIQFVIENVSKKSQRVKFRLVGVSLK